MGNKNADASYYENIDFSSLMRNSKKKKYLSANTKRVTMNISELAYDEAHEIDKYMNMGYQNVLKTAIMLGLNDLFDQMTQKKKTKR
jgi:hypothetical protein